MHGAGKNTLKTCAFIYLKSVISTGKVADYTGTANGYVYEWQ